MFQEIDLIVNSAASTYLNERWWHNKLTKSISCQIIWSLILKTSIE
jgi:hypothetical protein